jgi:hypothetical protein
MQCHLYAYASAYTGMEFECVTDGERYMTRSDKAGDTARIADNQVLQALAGPRLSLEELRERLNLSADTFMAVWEGRCVLYGAARKRLVKVLREEIAWHEDLLVRLERDRAEEGAPERIHEDPRQER